MNVVLAVFIINKFLIRGGVRVVAGAYSPRRGELVLPSGKRSWQVCEQSLTSAGFLSPLCREVSPPIGEMLMTPLVFTVNRP